MKLRLFVPTLLAAALAGALDASAQDSEFISLELGARGFMGENDARMRKGPGTSHVRVDDDLDAGSDTTGAGLSLTGKLKGGHSFNIQGWQYASDGSATMTEAATFGGITIPAGGSTNTDVDIRYVSAKFVFGLTPAREPFRVGLGMAGKVLDWKTEVAVDGVGSETLKMRMIYPAAELEVGYSLSEAFELRAEGSLGMPAFAKHEIEIQTPIEVRAGARFSLSSVTLEVGYQVLDALLISHENQPEEESANINLSGIYFEIAARF